MKTVKAKPAKAKKQTAKVEKNKTDKNKNIVKSLEKSLKSTKKIKGIKGIPDEITIIEPLEEDEHEAPHAELDPEVIEALNIKKKPKVKGIKSVDYIPELEREDSFLDDSFGGNM